MLGHPSARESVSCGRTTRCCSYCSSPTPVRMVVHWRLLGQRRPRSPLSPVTPLWCHSGWVHLRFDGHRNQQRSSFLRHGGTVPDERPGTGRERCRWNSRKERAVLRFCCSSGDASCRRRMGRCSTSAHRSRRCLRPAEHRGLTFMRLLLNRETPVDLSKQTSRTHSQSQALKQVQSFGFRVDGGSMERSQNP